MRAPLGSRPMLVRFELLVDRRGGPDACHPWQGRVNRDGYGVLSRGDEQHLAQRLAVEFARGRELRPEQDVLPLCEHPRCCNTRHLVVVTEASGPAGARLRGASPPTLQVLEPSPSRGS